MKLETFFEKFEHFADASNAVAMLRQLILDLALQGRILGGRFKTSQAEWKRFRLDSVATIAMGNSPPGESYNERGEGVPLINGPAEFSPGPFGQTVRTKFTSAPTKFCKRGDLLICVRGSTTGRTNIASFDACIGRGVAAINAGESQAYVNLFIWQRRSMIFAMGTGSTFPSVSYNDIASLGINLPSLAEQKRIVAKVDELMALCDRLEEQLRDRETQHTALARAALARFAEAPTSANLEFLFHNSYAISPGDLRNSILTLAVQGKLVPQDAAEETADQFLDRLGLQSSVVPAVLSVDEYRCPIAWTRVAFDDVAQVSGGVTLGRKLDNRKVVTLPYLRVANVKRGELDLSTMKEVSIPEEQLERYSLQHGDLLMIEGGDWDKVGRAAIWRDELPLCLHQNHVFRARMRSAEITSTWFELYFNSPVGRKYFESASKQTTNLASINMRQVRGCVVPFPPAAEQKRILAKVNQLMTLVGDLEARLHGARIMSSQLLDSIAHSLIAPNRASPEEVDSLKAAKSRLPNRNQFRTMLSAEIVHRLHYEPTFGRVKHQKILHLCEHIAQLKEIDGRYSRQAAGPLDGRMLHAVEADLKKQEWYVEVPRESFGHAYQPLAKAGGHANDFAALWPYRVEQIRDLIELMRRWDTDKCELFATAYAAWNDLLIWGREPTDDAILHEVLERWHPDKKRFTRKRWKSMLEWIRREGYAPTGFGKATTSID